MFSCKVLLYSSRFKAQVPLIYRSLTMASHLRIGIFGGGVVGGGVYELVQKCVNSGRFGAVGASIEIAKICVRDLSKTRDFELKSGCTLVTDYNDILGDPSINCVVELMGGVTSAKEVVFGAIKAGKHVVTANKALIAAFLPELQASLAANPSVRFNYEAAVCGGIPIIHSLHTDFLADDVTSIMGIMNGTTNFMLCKMEDEGSSYDAALKEAQALGFAEADPTADVEGHDVQAKICILAKLAYGKSMEVKMVPTAGISKVTDVDFAYAKTLGSTIKLVGTASTNSDGSLAVFVSPTMVPLSSPLAAAKGPGNCVVISTKNMGTSVFSGPGAGRFPTANSVLNDLIRLSLDKTCAPFPISSEIAVNPDYTATFYIRIKCHNGVGVIKGVGAAAASAGLNIFSIIQNPSASTDGIVNFVVITEKVKISEVNKFIASVSKEGFCLGLPLSMPMLV